MFRATNGKQLKSFNEGEDKMASFVDVSNFLTAVENALGGSEDAGNLAIWLLLQCRSQVMVA